MPKILESIATVAPTIATALGGPLGGATAKFVLDKLGVSSKSSENAQEALESLLTVNPEKMLELKKLDVEFKKFLAEKDIKIEEIYAKDRDSARQRQVNMKDHTPTVLAVIVICTWVYVQIFFLHNTFPNENSEVVMRALGILDGVLISVFAFYFGSSKGSKDKDKAMADKLNKN